jgi:YaaC-like Protein
MAYIRDTAEVWSRLFLYESRDQTARLFRDKHNRDIGAQKAREINSAFAQGREYFTAAAGAGELVSPLLQYYGVLALSRGTILFARPEARERSLAQRHGLRIVGWDGLKSGDASRLDALRLKIMAGTLSDLAVTTNNRCLEWIDADMKGTWFTGAVLTDIARQVPAIDSETVVRDLLRRIPALADLCNEVFEDGSACHYATIRVTTDGTTASVVLEELRNDRVQLETLVSSLGFGNGVSVKQVADPSRFGQEPHWVVEVVSPDRGAVLTSLPRFQRLPGTIGIGETMYVIEPYPFGRSLSPLLALFSLSFFLGTMVRYHPSAWRTLLNREKGDFLYPIFKAVAALIRSDYPRLILDELEN